MRVLAYLPTHHILHFDCGGDDDVCVKMLVMCLYDYKLHENDDAAREDFYRIRENSVYARIVKGIHLSANDHDTMNF